MQHAAGACLVYTTPATRQQYLLPDSMRPPISSSQNSAHLTKPTRRKVGKCSRHAPSALFAPQPLSPPTTQHNLRQHRNTRPISPHTIIRQCMPTATAATTPASAPGRLVFMCFIEIGHMVIPSCCVCAWYLSWFHVTRKSQPNTGK